VQVAELRRRVGVSQAELADMLGVTQPAVSAWEAGRRTPTGAAAEKLERIAIVFDAPTRVAGEFRGRPIELPEGRWDPVVTPDHEIDLPNHIDWTPRQGRWDLRDPDQRAGAYAQVLDEGTAADIQIWIDPDELVAMWPEVPVARHMRRPVADLIVRLR
jgi:transcriptional regulator with XRE-family HTH domain